jgi:hypothetical protein
MIAELKGELTKRGLGMMDSKPELQLALKEYIQERVGGRGKTHKTRFHKLEHTKDWDQQNRGNSREISKSKCQYQESGKIKTWKFPVNNRSSVDTIQTKILERLKKLETSKSIDSSPRTVEELTIQIDKLKESRN